MSKYNCFILAGQQTSMGMRFNGTLFTLAIVLFFIAGCKTSSGLSGKKEKKDAPNAVMQPVSITDYAKLLLGTWELRHFSVGDYSKDTLGGTYIFSDNFNMTTQTNAGEVITTSYTLRSDTIFRQDENGGVEAYKILVANQDDLTIELLGQKMRVLFSIARIK